MSDRNNTTFVCDSQSLPQTLGESARRANPGTTFLVERTKFKTKENIMFKLKSALAACLALAMIGGIIAYSSQLAKSSNSDAKTSFNPNEAKKTADAATNLPTTVSRATAPLPATNVVAKAEDTAPAASPAAGGKRPNIVILMTDDTGWGDFGCYSGGGAALGHPTPHIDRLAKEGAVFTSWYGQASC